MATLLGHYPRGAFEVAKRNDDGVPVVIRNAPHLFDGTPMPTLYWLTGPAEIRAIGQLESSGGVNAAEGDVDPDALEAAHRRYAAERDALIDRSIDRPAPSGGVAGTRRGVKCLHAHYAYWLVGGDDPVGRWVEDRLHPSPTP